MTGAGGPDFGAIAASYAYFLEHSTETAAQVAALAPIVAAAFDGGGRRCLLDFGCGDGAFLERLLDAAGSPRDLCLTVVEPADRPRAAAAERLRTMPGSQVAAVADLADVPASPVDLILANHSLYYVTDPAASVAALCARRADGGSIVAAMLDRGNALARIWVDGYAAMGARFPYCLAEDIAEALSANGLEPRATRIAYRIDMPDTAVAREHMVRFLFGPTIAGSHGKLLGGLFDRYRRGDRIVIDTGYPNLVAGRLAG